MGWISRTQFVPSIVNGFAPVLGIGLVDYAKLNVIELIFRRRWLIFRPPVVQTAFVPRRESHALFAHVVIPCCGRARVFADECPAELRVISFCSAFDGV